MNQSQIIADPSSLVPNPWNSNVVSPDNEAKLEESIKRFGMFKPIVVRELDDGSLQIIGGEHRAAAATRLGLKKVPAINLGRISDEKAKEISVVDNGRYGADNALQLAELLDGLGNVEELSSFMPYTEADLASIFSSVNIALDDLDIPDIDETAPVLPKEKPIQTHQIMRFKVPVDDSSFITDLIERTMKVQKFTESDSLTNAGDALVYLLKKAQE
jgi:ParB-like chromosome segregation protein Spo0J